MMRRREHTASWQDWRAQGAEATPHWSPAGPRPRESQRKGSRLRRSLHGGPETGVSWRARETVHRHEEANHEQGYGQEEGSEEEAGKVSAGKARCEAGEETEPRVSGLRGPQP